MCTVRHTVQLALALRELPNVQRAKHLLSHAHVHRETKCNNQFFIFILGFTLTAFRIVIATWCPRYIACPIKYPRCVYLFLLTQVRA